MSPVPWPSWAWFRFGTGLSAFHRIRFNISGTFVVALLCFLLASLVQDWTIRTFQDANHGVIETYAVLGSIHEMKARILRVESDSRGFIATGKASYLTAIDAQETSAKAQFDELRIKLGGSGRQQTNFARLAPLLSAKFSDLRHAVQLRKTGDAAAAVALLTGDEPRRVAQEITAIINAMVSTERDLVALREAASKRTARTEFWVGNLFRLFAVLLLANAYLRLNRVFKMREAAEGALLNRTSELEDAQRLAQVGNWRWNRLNDTLTWSAELFRMTGHTPASRPPSTAEQAKLYTPESWARLNKEAGAAMATTKPFSCEIEMIRTDGIRRWVLVRGEPELNPAGQVVGLRGTSQDITRQRAIDTALQRLNMQLEQAQRQASVGSWSSNLETGECIYSAEFYRIVDCPDTIPLVTWQDAARFFTPQTWTALEECISNLVISGTPFEREHELIRLDGECRWVVSRGTACCNPAGVVVEIHGTLQDVTQRHRYEEALNRKTFELEESQRLARVGSWSSQRHSTLVSWSKQMYEIYGIPVDSVPITSDDLPRFFTPETRVRIRAAVAKLMQDGTPQELEHELIQPNGNRLWVASYYELRLNAAGHVEGLRGSVVDVTQRKRAEDAMRHAKELAENAAQSKADFLAAMSHEMRTPMNGVIGTTSLLLSTPLSQQQRAYVESMRSSGEALLALLNDILDFSKIEAGQLPLENVPFNLPQTVEESLDVIGNLAAEKTLRIRYEAPGLVEQITGDPLRIRQILLNLLSNAIKFTETGTITLTITQRNCSTGKCLHFAVSDTGIGISETQMGKLFQSFSQADASTSRRYGGSGLGLAISRRLVNLMGGEMGVESMLGKGSTFWFELPLKTSSQQIVPSTLLCKQLLIVSGDPADLLQAHQSAQAAGLAVTTAATLHQALNHPRPAANWDAVLIDCNTSHIDPFDFAQRLRKHSFCQRLPILFWGSQRDLELLSKVAQVGHATYLMKPLLRKHLTAALDGLSTQAAESKPTQSPRLAPLNGTILIAEDNQINQTVLRHMLRLIGCSSQIVPDGRQAVDAVRDHHFDLILMDCQMPEMDGLEASKAIRQSGGDGASIPIVALTASALTGDREKCLAAGMNDYLTKPIQLERLHQALSHWLSLPKAHAAAI